jgi:hypothetical protein
VLAVSGSTGCGSRFGPTPCSTRAPGNRIGQRGVVRGSLGPAQAGPGLTGAGNTRVRGSRAPAPVPRQRSQRPSARRASCRTTGTPRGRFAARPYGPPAGSAAALLRGAPRWRLSHGLEAEAGPARSRFARLPVRRRPGSRERPPVLPRSRLRARQRSGGVQARQGAPGAARPEGSASWSGERRDDALSRRPALRDASAGRPRRRSASREKTWA